MMGTIDFFAPLTEEELKNPIVLPPEEELIALSPVPVEANEMRYQHPEYGPPSKIWPYYDRQERLVGYIARFDFISEDQESAKEYCPITYCISSLGGSAWRQKGLVHPIPLYRLKDIRQRTECAVLVCEGEKTADAASLLFPEMVTTTSAYGAVLPSKTDWADLHGRRVIIAPDFDGQGKQYCEEVSELAYAAGATEVLVLQPEKIARWIWVDGLMQSRNTIPRGWDLDDAKKDGWDAKRIADFSGEPGFFEPLPKPLVVGDSGRVLYRLTAKGVERRVSKKADEYWVEICGLLELEALTNDGSGKNWGKLFKFTNPDGVVSKLTIPNETLAGDGTPYREIFANCGLAMTGKKIEREYLQEYLSKVCSEKRVTCVNRLGWHGKAFVTNSGILGQAPCDVPIVYQGNSQSKIGRTGGTFEGWQEHVAKPAIGNSRLIFSLSAAFTGPLLLLTSSESGGFHFVGSSSVGKTTALTVAGSVWGGGTTGYSSTWRATSNGLEGIAASHCDALLCLDELGQVRSYEAGAAAYMLANGVGKIRSNRFGDARPPAVWRLIFLSTGEIGLADKVAEDGKGKLIAAGQQIRILDINADAGEGSGLFQNLHQHSSAEEFARQLKESAETHYGHAARIFIERVAADTEAVTLTAKTLVDDFLNKFRPTGQVDGQVIRVARRFGIVAAAGELAISWGIVSWKQGDAMSAVGQCFSDWLKDRGTAGSLETEQAISIVRAFIEEHGSSRFENHEDSDSERDFATHNRVGFFKKGVDGKRIYCFFSTLWKTVICKGHNPKQVAQALKAAGLLETGRDGRPDKTVRLGDDIHRVYAVKEAIILHPYDEDPPKSTFSPELMAIFRDQEISMAKMSNKTD